MAYRMAGSVGLKQGGHGAPGIQLAMTLAPSPQLVCFLVIVHRKEWHLQHLVSMPQTIVATEIMFIDPCTVTTKLVKAPHHTIFDHHFTAWGASSRATH